VNARPGRDGPGHGGPAALAAPIIMMAMIIGPGLGLRGSRAAGAEPRRVG
jgi:hypothetical protein